jgi:hypothetical protein
MKILDFPPGAFLVNQVEVPEVYDETSALSENKHGVLSHYGIDEKQHAPADAEVPEGQRHDAFALSLARNPLDKKSPEKEALADKAENEQIIVKAITDHVAESERVHCYSHGVLFPILLGIKKK